MVSYRHHHGVSRNLHAYPWSAQFIQLSNYAAGSILLAAFSLRWDLALWLRWDLLLPAEMMSFCVCGRFL